MLGQPGLNARPHARLAPIFLGKDARMTSQLNVVFHRKLRGSLVCLSYFWHVIHGCLKNRHWQTSGRLVQELNVCTVCMYVCLLTVTSQLQNHTEYTEYMVHININKHTTQQWQKRVIVNECLYDVGGHPLPAPYVCLPNLTNIYPGFKIK